MADVDHTRIELTGAIYECEILAQTLICAVEALQRLPGSGGITGELQVTLKLCRQLEEMVDRLAGLLRQHFAPATQ